jgi:hypothetical protein
MSILPIAGVFVASFAATLVVFAVVPSLARSVRARPAPRARHAAAAPDPAAQPDEIQLVPAGPGAWHDPAAAGRLAADLLREGFRNAGVFTAPALPGVCVQLFAHPVERLIGVVHEHAGARPWVDVAERRGDGTTTTWTSARGASRAARPGHARVLAPGLAPGALVARARRERAPGAAEAVHVAEVEALFERWYAEETAWRKALATANEDQRGASEKRIPSSPSVTSPS